MVKDFQEAAEKWDLDRLDRDLAAVKGKGLTPTEKRYLRGLLCYYGPQAIAERLNVTPDTVRKTLSNGVYPYIEALLRKQAEELIEQTDRQSRGIQGNRVPHLLSQLGYQRSFPSSASPPSIDQNPVSQLQTKPQPRCNWGNAPEVEKFYGRCEELQTLKQWISEEKSRLIAVLGLPGIGKTDLITKLSQEVQHQFDYLVWRSVYHSPLLEDLLADLWLRLGENSQADCVNSPLLCFIDRLRQHRCLVILDDFQEVLEPETLAGQYRSGYQNYGNLLQSIGKTQHQSCVLLTSREKPREVDLSGCQEFVHTFQLGGIKEAEARLLLAERSLSNEKNWSELIQNYRGNPLALKIVATTIQTVFDGNVSDFLDQSTFFLGDFSCLLHESYKRLSGLERSVMQALATAVEAVTLAELRHLLSPISGSELMQTMESLQRRCLVEKVRNDAERQFTVQPVVRKFVLNCNRSL
jgi:DNA-binding CsgD family transcriptional regulator